MNDLLKNKTVFCFDMDGVLVDSENLYVFCEQEVCRSNGIVIPETEWQGFKGRTNTDIFGYINKNFGQSKFDIDDLIEQKRNIVLSNINKIQLFSGVIDFLSFVRARFSYVALTTSTSRPLQEKIFALHSLQPFFDKIITGDRVSKGKPDPEAYLLTLDALGVEPSQALVLEDSDNGIIAAKQADCLAIGITHTFPAQLLAKAGADLIVDNFEELRGLLAE